MVGENGYHSVPEEDLADLEWTEEDAGHDSVYTNPVQAAKHLIRKFDEEEARDYFAGNGASEERIEEIISDAEAEMQADEGGKASEPSDDERPTGGEDKERTKAPEGSDDERSEKPDEGNDETNQTENQGQMTFNDWGR